MDKNIRIFVPTLLLTWWILSSFDTTWSNDVVPPNFRVDIDRADSLKFEQPEESLKIALQALQFGQETNDKELIARSELIQGEIFRHYEAYDISISHLKNALEIFKDIPVPDKVFESFIGLSHCCYSSGSIDLAYKYARNALDIARESQDTEASVYALLRIGAAQSQLPEFSNDSTLKIFYRTRSLAEKMKRMDIEATSTFNIAVIHKNNRDYDSALHWTGVFASKFENKRDVDKILISAYYNILATIYTEMEEVAVARHYIDISETYINEHLDPNTRLDPLSRLYRNKYRLDSLTGDYQSALQHHMYYSAINDSISSEAFGTKMANYEVAFQVSAIEDEMAKMAADNELKDLKIKQRTFLIYASIGVILLLIAIFIHLNSLQQKIKQKNNNLSEQKEELKTANDHVQEKNLQLRDRNEELETLIEEIKNMQQQLIQSEKMASLGTFVFGIMHEVNNPLNFIMGGQKLLDKNLKSMGLEKDDLLKPLHMIEEGSERIRHITSSLSYFTVRKDGIQKSVRVHEIIENILFLSQSRLKAEVTLTKNYLFKDPLNLYPDKISQVFLNLLDNAIYAVNRAQANIKEIRITVENVKNTLRTEIYNTGSPIPKKNLNQVFDPFFTTKDPGEGSGLGLSNSYQMIHDHGGSITVKNKTGGVSFIIEIPIT